MNDVLSRIDEKGKIAPASPFEMAVITRYDPDVIEGIWRLFNNFPKVPSRLEKATIASMRLAALRRDSMLPPRRAYTTTVDYYEAALPLFRARALFRSHFLPSDSLTTLSGTCKGIVPGELF